MNETTLDSSIDMTTRYRGTYPLVTRAVIPLVAAFAVVAGSCGADERPEPDGWSAPVFSEWDVLPRVVAQAYRGDDFVQVNAAPYPSSVTDASINVFVSVDGWWEFLHATPDAEGMGKELPIGAVIVREVLDDRGEVASLTLMSRGPDGYSPGHGDFWYALLEPDGFPHLEAGEPLIGRLEERCAGCHDERAGDGYLFGVPHRARMPHLPVPG